MKLLFIFLDGVGLGSDDPSYNPFALGIMPVLQDLLNSHRLVKDSLVSQHLAGPKIESSRATLLSLDACLSVEGLPQSATGQTTLLTGINIPAEIGYHYGPKPNPEVAAFLRNGNLFSILEERGCRVALLNAYPPAYFQAIESGRRLYSAIPLAVTSAGVPLKTAEDLFSDNAISADITGRGWRERLGFPNAPLLTPHQAGARLAALARDYEFAFFEFWLTDYLGHYQNMQNACSLLEMIDTMFLGLLEAWNDQDGLILLTSDHGNLEDLSTRRHTTNPVPGLVIGDPSLRRDFCSSLSDLTGVTPAIVSFFS